MDFLERDLEDVICDALNTKEGQESLYDKGFHYSFTRGHLKYKRQLNLGVYGICDLVISSRDDTEISEDWGMLQSRLTIEVVELKKGVLNERSLTQVMRYVKGVERYMQRHHPKSWYVIIPTLVGRSIDLGDWVYMIDRIEGLRVFTYKYGIDGITFEEHSGYYKTGDNC